MTLVYKSSSFTAVILSSKMNSRSVLALFQLLVVVVVFDSGVINADFSFTHEIKNAGERLSFPVYKADNLIINWGDDKRQTFFDTKYVSHQFTAPGVYTVTLTDSRSFPKIDPRAMILEIDMSKNPFGSNKLNLPLKPAGEVKVIWGDGTEDGSLTHTYAEKKIYRVIVLGKFKGFIELYGLAPFLKGLTRVFSFGSLGITNWSSAFLNAKNLIYVSPIFEGATNLSGMFVNAVKFNSDIGDWETSLVTDMSYMFSGATSFNQNLGSWKKNKELTMVEMFDGATKFRGTLPGSKK